MSLSEKISRRAALFGLAGLLSACGFQPIYGPGASGGKLRNSVQIVVPESTDGFRLSQHLRQKLGQVENLVYELTLTLDIREEAVAITTDQQNTRFNVPGSADWILRDAASQVVLAQGQVDSFTSYSATGTVVATRAAQRDARDRLTAGLADLIVARLLLLSPQL